MYGFPLSTTKEIGVARNPAPTANAIARVRASGSAADIVATPRGRKIVTEVIKPGENLPRLRIKGGCEVEFVIRTPAAELRGALQIV